MPREGDEATAGSLEDAAGVAATLTRPDVHSDWESVYRTSEAQAFADRLMDRIVEVCDTPAGTTWLDAGCGPGFHAMRLARHGFQVVGVDFAEVVLDAARENIRAAGLQESLELQRGDLTRLSFPTGSFRRVLCWGVLMHVPDLDAAVAELSRVLAPGGLLAVNDTNLASLDNLAIAVRDRLGRSAPQRRRTRVGVERWKTTAAGPLLIRQSDMNRLVSAFESHGLRLRARFAGELTETYAITGDERLRRAIHRVNDVWFRRVRVAGPAQSNVIVLERPETAS